MIIGYVTVSNGENLLRLLFSCEPIMSYASHFSNSNSFFETHRVLLYCLVSLFVCGAMVVFPLSKDFRDRRRRRFAAFDSANRPQDHENLDCDESALLLRQKRAANTYGTGTYNTR